MKYLHPQSFTQESGRLSSFLALTILLLLQGCAERPSTQIDGVRQSIEDARLAGAQNYAFELLEQAETSYRLALDELNQQDERLALWRSYSKVREILALAHSQAEEAKSAALANLEETKSNAQMALSQARQQIVQAQAFLDHPLSPYSLLQSFVELQRALEGAEALLDNMETSMGSEDYIHIMTSAHAVESLAFTIHQRILSVLSQLPSTKVEV